MYLGIFWSNFGYLRGCKFEQLHRCDVQGHSMRKREPLEEIERLRQQLQGSGVLVVVALVFLLVAVVLCFLPMPMYSCLCIAYAYVSYVFCNLDEQVAVMFCIQWIGQFAESWPSHAKIWQFVSVGVVWAAQSAVPCESLRCHGQSEIVTKVWSAGFGFPRIDGFSVQLCAFPDWISARHLIGSKVWPCREMTSFKRFQPAIHHASK